MMHRPRFSTRDRSGLDISGLLGSDRLVWLALFSGCAVYLWRSMGITSDAYITMRVVDNFLHGYGLRWNIDDRVQVYTHPLWLLLNIPVYAVVNEAFYTLSIVSISLSLATLYVFMRTFSRPLSGALAFIILPLMTSASYVTTSTLGLENPLSHFLFSLIGWLLVRKSDSQRFWLYLYLLVSLLLLTRLDYAIFVFPLIAGLTLERWQILSVRQCLLGLAPIMAWSLFSLFYYGFLLPNTAYAKLPGSFTDADFIRQGLIYLLNFLALDAPAVLLMGICSLLFPVAWICSPKLRKRIPSYVFYICIGILYHALYVVSVGGTYISYRFLSLPAVASLWVANIIIPQHTPKRVTALVMVGFCCIMLTYPPASKIQKACPLCFAGVIEERWHHINVKGIWRGKGRGMKRPTVIRSTHKLEYVEFSGVGFWGYEGGPFVHYINPYAFTDPLLARLPPVSSITNGPSQSLARKSPKGYREALATGSFDVMDPDLAVYLRALETIISGNLMDWQRLKTIIAFNLGQYDLYLKRYLAKQKGAAVKH